MLSAWTLIENNALEVPNYARFEITEFLQSNSDHPVNARLVRLSTLDMVGSNLVLITGATGHVGSRTLLHVLQAGYDVRVAVRSESKAASVLSRPQIQALNPGQRLTFTVVPDITAPGAYDEAVIDGVTHIIHIASPLVTADTVPLRQHNNYFIRPAVQGTLAMLRAAERSGTVRRVVITSSITALVPVTQMEGVEARKISVQPTDRMPVPSEPYESEFAAYTASKVAALDAAESWMARRRPPFDVVHLHPSFVLGHNDAATTPAEAMRGTNAVVLAMLLGQVFGPYAGATVHVDDVARAHVRALHPSIPGNQSYILSQPAVWNDAKDIVQQAFPTAMESRLLVTRGHVDSVQIPIDASLTEETFGFTFASFEDQVRDVVRQFLELRMQKRPRMNAISPAAAKSREEAAFRVKASA